MTHAEHGGVAWAAVAVAALMHSQIPAANNLIAVSP